MKKIFSYLLYYIAFISVVAGIETIILSVIYNMIAGITIDIDYYIVLSEVFAILTIGLSYVRDYITTTTYSTVQYKGKDYLVSKNAFEDTVSISRINDLNSVTE